MNIVLREATLEDAKAICDLSRQLGHTSTILETTERLKDIIANRSNCVFVAVAAGEVIGWIHGFCATRITSEPFAEIGGRWPGSRPESQGSRNWRPASTESAEMERTTVTYAHQGKNEHSKTRSAPVLPEAWLYRNQGAKGVLSGLHQY